MPSKIEWCDLTVNPAWGCTKVSRACLHCYAASFASRNLVDGMEGLAVRGEWTGELRHKEGDWAAEARKRRKPARVFVGSMTDVGHPKFEIDWLAECFDVFASMPRHTWMLLTKRPAELGNKIRRIMLDRGWKEPLANVWVGVTLEEAAHRRRADSLRALQAAVRYLSCEPLMSSLNTVDLSGIDWVIAGGESGSHAEPSHPDWFRELRDRCVVDDRAFHFKQWGEWAAAAEVQPGQAVVLRAEAARRVSYGTDAAELQATMSRVGKYAAGRVLDGRTWDEFPGMLG